MSLVSTASFKIFDEFPLLVRSNSQCPLFIAKYKAHFLGTYFPKDKTEGGCMETKKNTVV
jgi:hypothetical protein